MPEKTGAKPVKYATFPQARDNQHQTEQQDQSMKIQIAKILWTGRTEKAGKHCKKKRDGKHCIFLKKGNSLSGREYTPYHFPLGGRKEQSSWMQSVKGFAS